MDVGEPDWIPVPQRANRPEVRIHHRIGGAAAVLLRRHHRGWRTRRVHLVRAAPSEIRERGPRLIDTHAWPFGQLGSRRKAGRLDKDQPGTDRLLPSQVPDQRPGAPEAGHREPASFSHRPAGDSERRLRPIESWHPTRNGLSGGGAGVHERDGCLRVGRPEREPCIIEQPDSERAVFGLVPRVRTRAIRACKRARRMGSITRRGAS